MEGANTAGEVVNLSSVQLHLMEKQLLVAGEELKSEAEQLEIGNGQHNLQGDQIQIWGIQV